MMSSMIAVATAVDVPVTLIPNFLNQRTANEAFDVLLAEIPWERRTTETFGKTILIPRMEVWVADYPYTYSGRTYQPKSWTPTLVKLNAEVEAALRTRFNSVLLNLYESGSDSVGWHSDDELEMSQDHPIASLSLGAIRSFQVRRGHGLGQTIELGHGSLLVMNAGMQKEWKHQVPKTMKPCGTRINLTFRWMNFCAD
jgi:alkylated DNA repair dioxygenase AlkB